MKIALYSEHWNRFWCLPPEMVEWIRTDFPQLEFIHARTEEAIGEAVQEAEIYFGYRLPKEALVGAKRLKWIHVPGTEYYSDKFQGVACRTHIRARYRVYARLRPEIH
jgi:hypothetical protein